MKRLTQQDRLRIRLHAVAMLRYAKKYAKYNYLSEHLNIDPSLLARYVSGLVVPSYEQSLKIISVLEKLMPLDKIILREIEKHHGYIDLTGLLSDPSFLRVVSFKLASHFKDDKPTAVLVPETSGISLASFIAEEFPVKIIVARRRKDNPLEDYYEEHLILPPNVRRIFYIRRRSLSSRDRVLIVDDIVHTGLTLYVLKKLISRIDAKLVGVASIVVHGTEWRKRLGDSIKIKSIVSL